MSDTDSWLTRYEQNIETVENPTVYWTAVPMVVLGTIGLLWHLPVPAEFYEISPLFNWGSAVLMVTAIYYFIISLSLAIGLLPFLMGLAGIQLWLINSSYPAVGVSIGLLMAGIVGLGLGRAGRVLLVFQDLQLIMIGPAWILSGIYRRFGIPL